MRLKFFVLLLLMGCQPSTVEVKIWRIRAYNPEGKLMETCIYRDTSPPYASYWESRTEVRREFGSRTIKEFPAKWYVKITEDKPAKAEVDAL